ncbi:MAG: MGMT family protein [Nanoarchaeota archaeon]|nr:MGMT family protein [Nanoarchaeota archaeon]MBU1704394.1 MGMT family protein [Nanoarchaeota archaeon]
MFNEKVLSLVKQIPRGRVTTYREIARALGTKAYQAVGNALRSNPDAPFVPCHRVVKNDGCVGGYKGVKDSRVKAELLEKEGVIVTDGIIDMDKYLFSFHYPVS